MWCSKRTIQEPPRKRTVFGCLNAARILASLPCPQQITQLPQQLPKCHSSHMTVTTMTEVSVAGAAAKRSLGLQPPTCYHAPSRATFLLLLWQLSDACNICGITERPKDCCAPRINAPQPLDNHRQGAPGRHVHIAKTAAAYPSIHRHVRRVHEVHRRVCARACARMSVRPSVRPFVLASVHPCVRPSVCPYVRVSVPMSPSVRPSVRPPARPPAHRPQGCACMCTREQIHDGRVLLPIFDERLS